MKSDSAGEIFKRLLRVQSRPRQESNLAELLISRLKEIGLTVNTDDAADRIGGTANNILAETAPEAEKTILLSAHIDTISGGSPESLVKIDNKLYNDGEDGLGADDKAGISVLLSVLNSRAGQLPPGLGIVFTVAEELGLLGASVLPVKYITRFDRALVLDGEAPAGTIFHQEPAACFFAISLNQSPLDKSLTSRQKMLLRKIRHYWDKSDLCLVSHLISGPLPAWNFFQEEILIVGIKGKKLDKIETQWHKRLQELKRYFGIRNDDLSYKLLHSCAGFKLDKGSYWLQKLESSLLQAGLQANYKKSHHISEAARFNDMGIEAVNLGLGLSNIHDSRENINLSSLKCLSQAIENFLLSY